MQSFIIKCWISGSLLDAVLKAPNKTVVSASVVHLYDGMSDWEQWHPDTATAREYCTTCTSVALEKN